MSAYVPGFCQVGRGAALVNVTVTIPVDAAGAISTAPQSFVVPAAVCNASASVTLRSAQGGAKIAGDAKGTDGKVDYIATASFGGAGASANTASSNSGAARTSQPAKGTVTVTIEPLQPTQPMLPLSAYTDTVTVMLLPQ